jgi:hypothetical protein
MKKLRLPLETPSPEGGSARSERTNRLDGAPLVNSKEATKPAPGNRPAVWVRIGTAHRASLSVYRKAAAEVKPVIFQA